MLNLLLPKKEHHHVRLLQWKPKMFTGHLVIDKNSYSVTHKYILTKF